MKKVSVKTIKEFMKTLEENRYKKIYTADARRVAWFVNNELSEDYENMPAYMSKRWSNAEYKNERHIAEKYLKSIKQNERVIRQFIRGILNESSVSKRFGNVEAELRNGKELWLVPVKGSKNWKDEIKDLKMAYGIKKVDHLEMDAVVVHLKSSMPKSEFNRLIPDIIGEHKHKLTELSYSEITKIFNELKNKFKKETDAGKKKKLQQALKQIELVMDYL